MKLSILLPLATSTLAAVTSAHVARADDTRVSHQAVSDDLHSYYGGESRSAYAILALGAASAYAGTILVTRNADFSRGLGWPLLTLGVLEGLGAIYYVFQVRSEVRHYESSLAQDAHGYQRDELAHMHGTRSRFVGYRLTEFALLLAGVGVATYGFVANRDAWKGAGIGISAVALPFVIIDTVNDARAKHYEETVRRFDPVADAPRKVEIAPIASTPWYVSYSGTF